MSALLAELKQRKLVQWALAYVAAAFALLQGVDIVAGKFGWPDSIGRALIIALCVGLFITMLLVWYHGERGAQKVSGTELLLLALLLAIGGGLLWKYAPGSVAPAPARSTGEDTPTQNADAIDQKSIAVLPFTDLSPAHDQEYFSDGMAEEILNALAQVKDLKVAGRTSSFFFKGKNGDLRAIGTTLGVANVLEGSVRKQGDKVRITAQLIQVSDGFHRWSQNYDGDLKDVFELQERIARAITDQLEVVLAGEQKTRLVAVATTNPDAYALYLQATAIFNRRDGAHFPDAIADLKEAIRLDPKYARAHARLASFYAIANNYDNTFDLADSQSNAERETQLAIGLDPAMAEPYAALGVIHEYHREWVASRESLEHAATLDPSDPTATFWLGLTQVDAGYRRLGLASIDRALAIDPLLPNPLAWRAFAYLDAGDAENARRMAQRSADQGLASAELTLALLAHAQGNDADAIARYVRGARSTLNGFPEGAPTILAQGVFGDAASRAKAVAMVEDYLATRPKTVSAGAPWALLQLGEPPRALALVEDPQTSNDTVFMFWLWTSHGAPARKLPQFAEFARKTKLTEAWEKYGAPDDCERRGPNDYVCH
jgi:TolB-like protein